MRVETRGFAGYQGQENFPRSGLSTGEYQALGCGMEQLTLAVSNNGIIDLRCREDFRRCPEIDGEIGRFEKDHGVYFGVRYI